MARLREQLIRWELPILVSFALAIRLIGLSSWGFEQDELYTRNDARDFGARSSGPGITARPLYYLIQRLCFSILPQTELGLRIPALVFGVLGVAFTWIAANRIFGRRAAMIAGVAVAVSPWHVYASQFARYWSLVYLLSVVAVFVVLRALETENPRRWLLAATVLWLGTITHPTFVFPLLAVVPIAHFLRADGRMLHQWPSRTAMLFGVAPLISLVTVSFAVSSLLTPRGHFGNGIGRGLHANISVFLAMVQWMGVEIFSAAILGATFMAFFAPTRRWGLIALGGVASTVVLLMVAGQRNDIYADYGMAMLPLLFLTLGAIAQAVATDRRATISAISAAAFVVAGSATGLVSHLSDGTRFDYRPALRTAQESDSTRPILTWPIVVARHYAPTLDTEELTGSRSQLEATSKRGPFFVIASEGRSGYKVMESDAERWIRENCRRQQESRRPRLDYRDYRAVLFACSPTQ